MKRFLTTAEITHLRTAFIIQFFLEYTEERPNHNLYLTELHEVFLGDALLKKNVLCLEIGRNQFNSLVKNIIAGRETLEFNGGTIQLNTKYEWETRPRVKLLNIDFKRDIEKLPRWEELKNEFFEKQTHIGPE